MLKKVKIRTWAKKLANATAASIAILCLTANASLAQQKAADDDYDRLDGTGRSGKTVNVIEWEGNLEVHVYPKGSLKGLALKLDKKNKDKPVMVIGYRFDNNPKEQLIRRAILGIQLNEGFKAYKDPSADDYDKVVISNNGLSLAAMKLDPPPAQLYPDGHPSNSQGDTQVASNDQPGSDEYISPSEISEKREPASRGKKQPAAQSEEDQVREAPKADVDEDGRIRPFFMEPKYRAR